MKKLVIGIAIAGFFSMAGTCNGSGGTNDASRTEPPTVESCELLGTCPDDGGGDPVAAVPEPSALLLGAAGAAVLGWSIRRRKR